MTVLSCLYQFIQSYQTLTVGAIGFTGVIITLITNAKISRNQHERSITHERASLRTALLAELELARKSFSDSSTPRDINHEEAAFFPDSHPQLVYRSLIAKIGLLSPAEISSVIEAYTLINELPTRLRLLSFGHDPSFNIPGYIYISEKHTQTAVGTYRSFLPKIEQALEALKSNT
jgi:hypothetical protein